MSDYKMFAKNLALEAGKIMRKNFSFGMKKEWKEDDTLLTVTDTTINQLVIDAVNKQFPSHGILGEEASDLKESEYVWVCDPLDGTIAFSHGYPTFVFSLALVKKGESIAGVIYDPIMDRMLSAEKGKGASLNEKPIQVSDKKQLTKDAFIDIETDLKLHAVRESLLRRDCIVSTLCATVYGSMLVACGEFVAEIYEYNKPWDAAAAKIIVEEAGGRCSDLLGNNQRYDKKINGFIASNGLVHEELVAIVGESLMKNR